MAERSIPDIAREALRLLALRKLPPTPENYQTVYEEVAGHIAKPPFPHKALRQIFSVLPTQSGVQKRIALHFNQAINEQNWRGIQQAIVAYANIDQLPAGWSGPSADLAPQRGPSSQILELLPPELAEQIARVIEHILPMLSEDEDRRMHDLTDQLVHFLRISPPPLQDLLHMLQNYAYRLSFSTEDQAQRRRAIQGLLRTVGAHSAELSRNDSALQSMSRKLLEALEKPWTQQHLDELQQQLQSLLLRQLDVHGKTEEAQEHIKQLLNESLLRLATLSESSTVQTTHIEQCVGQLEQAQGLADLTPVLAELMSATRAIAAENRAAHAALQDLRTRSAQEQQSIQSLQKALDTAEELARHDPLTRCLNTKGLEDELERELSRANRYHTPLSVASIALEGLHAMGLEHGAGMTEQAQRHFAMVARSVLRPQDALARDQPGHYFLLLPNTSADEALQALIRLQEELPRRPLLSDDEKIPLVISAGVVQAWPSEARLDLVNRADQSLQHAQMAGAGGRLARG